ncbi:MAG TPA: DUF3090 domain-containing protein [Actinomycetes bacterium]
MPQVFDFDPPDRFVVGTVGEPGQRTFYLQASGAGRVTSVALEKQQVALLVERTNELLDQVRGAGITAVPPSAPPELDDRAPLDTPISEEFRVGTLTLAWDGDTERLVIEAFAVEDADAEGTDAEGTEDEGEGIPTPPRTDVLRVHLTGSAARAFAQRGQAVVGAGRPPCPFCELPLDPAGHLCPRQNGHRRR